MNRPRDGDLYRILRVGGEEFVIRYGFYQSRENDLCDEPEPIFPDFTTSPLYTAQGEPFATADQDICEHYSPKPTVSGEEWCNDCRHFLPGEEAVGICACRARRWMLRKNE